jgi:hypothetical protein
MKKVLLFASIAGMACLIACGQSPEQKAAAEKAKADSVAAAQRADSMAMAAKKQHMDDSIKAAQPKADTTKPAEVKEEKKK